MNSIIYALFVAIFVFIFLVVRLKGEFTFSSAESDNKQSNLFWLFLLYSLVGLFSYALKKWIELPNFIGLENPVTSDSLTNWQIFILYFIAIFILLIIFIRAVQKLARVGRISLVNTIHHKLKKGKYWKKYQFFKQSLILPSPHSYRKFFYLPKNEFSKYSKKDIYRFVLFDRIEDGVLDGFLFRFSVFVIAATLAFYSISSFFYQNLLSNELEFIINNDNEFQFTQFRERYWLVFVWIGSRTLLLLNILVLIISMNFFCEKYLDAKYFFIRNRNKYSQNS